MIVIDPIVGVFPRGGPRSTSHDLDIRDLLAPLNTLADELDLVLVGVRHLGKDRNLETLDRVLGGVDWVNVPRAVLAIARDDEDDDVRHVQVIAGNRVPAGEAGRSFRIVGVQLPELPDGEPVTKAELIGVSTKDVNDLLGAAQKPRSSASGHARELILDVLETEGEQESDTLDARVAGETDLAVKTIKNIRTALKDEGLIKVWPEKDEYGTIVRWLIVRTQAPRP